MARRKRIKRLRTSITKENKNALGIQKSQNSCQSVFLESDSNESEKIVQTSYEDELTKRVKITSIYSPSFKNKLILRNVKIPI